MLGAIAGDVIGSRFEHTGIKSKHFDLFNQQSAFTDDTVHTVALADSILHKVPFPDKLREYYQCYPGAGYGGRFRRWAESSTLEPYQSYGNGSAMRVSPVAWLSDSLQDVLSEARKSAVVTHDHPEGVRGAQAVAGAVFMARNKAGKKAIRAFVEDVFSYDLSATLDEIRRHYRFDVTCQGSVPQAIRAFLEAEGFEDAVRNAVSLGGDSDTQACIAGSIAEAYFGGVPAHIKAQTESFLDQRILTVLQLFDDRQKSCRTFPAETCPVSV
ncbi:MAG: ADP-ribosylglycohydrolase family protein [Desulfuromonadales bacterium]